MALAAAAALGLVAVAALIWRRESLMRHSSTRSALSGLALKGSQGAHSGSLDLKLELDGK